MGVCPVGSLSYQGKKYDFCQNEQPGKVCQQLLGALTSLQTLQGDTEDKHDWVVPLDKMPTLVSECVK